MTVLVFSPNLSGDVSVIVERAVGIASRAAETAPAVVRPSTLVASWFLDEINFRQQNRSVWFDFRSRQILNSVIKWCAVDNSSSADHLLLALLLQGDPGAITFFEELGHDPDELLLAMAESIDIGSYELVEIEPPGTLDVPPLELRVLPKLLLTEYEEYVATVEELPDESRWEDWWRDARFWVAERSIHHGLGADEKAALRYGLLTRSQELYAVSHRSFVPWRGRRK